MLKEEEEAYEAPLVIVVVMVLKVVQYTKLDNMYIQLLHVCIKDWVTSSVCVCLPERHLASVNTVTPHKVSKMKWYYRISLTILLQRRKNFLICYKTCLFWEKSRRAPQSERAALKRGVQCGVSVKLV